MKATDQRIRAEILARYDVDARRCREVFFPAGQQLHAQDAPLENIFLVISGSIFISKSSSNGLSGASCYECTHGCIGAMEIFLDTMRFDCSSVASTDVTTFLLPIDYVQELLQSSFTFVRQIASDLAEQLQHTHVILNDAQTHAAVERLARYLMVVSEQQLYRSGIQQAATAIGVSYFIQNMALYITGGLNKNYPAIPWISDPVRLFGMETSRVTVITPFLTIALVIALVLLINHTKIGMAMRAVSVDFETAQLMGIKINSVISATFIIGTFLAAVGSVLFFTNFPGVVPTSGAMPGLKAFVAAVFGGIGSVPGAVVGAFIIGICESVIKGLDTILMANGAITEQVGFATFSDAFTFVLLIVILVFKPTGLFGEKTTDKV